MIEWYEIEYSYTKTGSNKIAYRGTKRADDKEEAAKLLAIIHGLSKVDKNSYTIKQQKIAKKYIGTDRFVRELGIVYKYTKTEVKIKKR